MKLYGDPASPYVTRVIILARLKGVQLERPAVPDGNPRSAAYHALNPLGKVPGLVIDGEMLPESEVICEYLEEAYPEPPCLPRDARERATSRLVARITDLYISPLFRPLLDHLDPAQRDQVAVAEIAAAWEKAFRGLDFYMGPGPFCVAEKPTLGDCALGPYVQLLKSVVFGAFDTVADPTFGDRRLATWWRALQDHPVFAEELASYGAAVDAFMAANAATLHEHR